MSKRSINEVDCNEFSPFIDTSLRHVGVQSGISRKYLIAFGAILIILSVSSVALGRYNHSQMSSADKIKYENTQAPVTSDTILNEDTTIITPTETTFVSESEITTGSKNEGKIS